MIFDSGGRAVWSSGTLSGSNGSSINFSSDPYYSGNLSSPVTIMVGSVSFTWNGVGADGDLVSTGDYIVKAQVTQGSSTNTLSKVLTVILQKQNLLGSVQLYPMPATNVLYFDLTQVTQGINVEIRVWNIAGQLVRTMEVTSGPQARIAWNLTTTGGKDLSNGIYFAALTTQSTDPSLQDKCFVKFVINGR